MVKLLDMDESGVETYVRGECAEKSKEDLMAWIDVLRADNAPEMNLSVAKLQCGLEISKGEYTRLEEGRPKFVEDFAERLKKIELPIKKYNVKTGVLEDKLKITYILTPNPEDDFVLPEITEQMALRYCKLTDEDAMALDSAEKRASSGDSKADVQALIDLQDELAAKYMVARNMFVTRTLKTEEAMQRKELKLKKAEASRNFKRWKISAIQSVIQERVTEAATSKSVETVTGWMNEAGLKAIAEE